jgi:dTMP kinase
MLEKRYQSQRAFMKKRFYTFEGIDGSGKTTLLNYLQKKLSKDKFYWTQEPYGTPLKNEIKSILQSTVQAEDSVTQYLAFATERSFHIKNIILPEIKKGKTVISDRFFYSSLAYQGLDIDPQLITDIYHQTNHGLAIDYIFYCKISPEVAIKRLQKRGKNFLDNYFEKKIYTLAKRYNALFANKTNVIEINMEEPVEKISKCIEKYFINTEINT